MLRLSPLHHPVALHPIIDAWDRRAEDAIDETLARRDVLWVLDLDDVVEDEVVVVGGRPKPLEPSILGGGHSCHRFWLSLLLGASVRDQTGSRQLLGAFEEVCLEFVGLG